MAHPKNQHSLKLLGLITMNFLLLSASTLRAETHTSGVPLMSSRPGSEYTVYLDVAGFTFNGMWSGGELGLPGTTLSVGDVAASASFNPAQVAEIKNIWSRMAQSYSGFNVNVTTVDPAAGLATDALRQAFYDNTPNMMHTIIGSQTRASLITPANPMGKWYSTGADGVSGLGIIAGTAGSAGQHTNWMFTEDQQGPGFINGDYIGAISAHENGHAFGLSHQGDWTGNTVNNAYTNGDATGTTTTPGTYVAILGNASDRQRVAWRVGDTSQDTHTVVNDVQRMLAVNTTTVGNGAADLKLVDDGIGHGFSHATILPINFDNTVNYTLANGIIVPLSSTNPQPLGASNYTDDWFKFTLASLSAITLTAHDSTQFLVPGVADGVGTLRSTLKIYDMFGALLGSATEDASTLFETYGGSLAAGDYYAKVSSYGGHVQDLGATGFNSASYFDMGAFFLTGSGFTVASTPEPRVALLLASGLFAIGTRRKRAKSC